jgi:uncharacterized protein
VIPGKAGQTLTFKALQTYSNGDVVRWIGAPDADEPAPRVQLTGGVGGVGLGRRPAAGEPLAGRRRRQAATTAGADTLSIIALALGAIGLVVARVALGGRAGKPLRGGRRA